MKTLRKLRDFILGPNFVILAGPLTLAFMLVAVKLSERLA